MSFVGDLSKATRLNEVYEKKIAELEKRNRRDMFAAASLSGFLTGHTNEKDLPFFVEASIVYADAMISALDA